MKRTQEKILKHNICAASRIIASISFLCLAIIGVSSLVRAMSLEDIANENGVPASWDVASVGDPDTITVPITYWDQREDECWADGKSRDWNATNRMNDQDIMSQMVPNRQFEWSKCVIYASRYKKQLQQGIVKDVLGADSLPIPAFTNATDAYNGGINTLSTNVTGHDPVQSTDNFYRWFHQTEKSSAPIEREITFNRTGPNSYTYGNRGVFPIDDVSFSNGDPTRKDGHNFHFTAHLQVPVRIEATGEERFDFTGDDDVWVFLNKRLVLDIGGVHEALSGSFSINQDGTITSLVTDATGQAYTKTVNIGVKAGDVVDLDFFYAERSTSESNTKITISHMSWPISADSTLNARVIGKIEGKDSNLIEYTASVSNRDIDNSIQLERIAAYIRETDHDEIDPATGQSTVNDGFLPLDLDTLYYSGDSNDNSWEQIDVTPPQNSAVGFNLTQPITLSPDGEDGSTAYFRYYAETKSLNGKVDAQINYYTSLGESIGVSFDKASVNYEASEVAPVKAKHDVKVYYYYEKDSEDAPDIEAHAPNTATVEEGSEFQIVSPTIEDYNASIDVIAGTMEDNDLEYIVRYSKLPDPEPSKFNVTIHYRYEDDSEAAPDYNADFEKGQTFSVNSPVVEGYEASESTVSGEIAEGDIEFIVRYIKVVEETPENPGQSEEKPSTPVPTLPVITSDDMSDSGLVLLAPLGVIAYVPNTGIINSTVAPIFEQYFADVILSQAFVLAMLTIFAVSFATYFSLRKYLNLSTVTRKTRRSPVAKRHKASIKAAKKQAKSARKAGNNSKAAKNKATKGVKNSQKVR